MKNINIGDTFDSFLEHEGILKHAEDVATRRVATYRFQEEHKDSEYCDQSHQEQ